ncbi:MAG: hypothetical protein ABSF22_15745 [Bryobacteraceae bacterium]
MVKFNLTTAALFCAALSANAAVITTNSGFLGSYTGPQNADLNVTSAQVSYNGVNLTFTATLGAAPFSLTPTAEYIWGIDRGLLSPETNFGAFAPGVLFDSLLVLTASGGTVAALGGTPGGGTLAAGAITISGNTITAVVPASLLPSSALTPGQYMVNLWPASSAPSGPAFAQIAEFAPSVNGDAAVTVTAAPSPTPAPATLALLAIGLISLAALTLAQQRKRA